MKVLTPRALYRLTCGLWTNWNVPHGLYGLRGLRDQSAKKVKIGTVLQITKTDLFFKRKRMKRKTEKKNGTKMQFLKVLGLKCNNNKIG